MEEQKKKKRKKIFSSIFSREKGGLGHFTRLTDGTAAAAASPSTDTRRVCCSAVAHSLEGPRCAPQSRRGRGGTSAKSGARPFLPFRLEQERAGKRPKLAFRQVMTTTGRGQRRSSRNVRRRQQLAQKAFSVAAPAAGKVAVGLRPPLGHPPQKPPAAAGPQTLAAEPPKQRGRRKPPPRGTMPSTHSPRQPPTRSMMARPRL